MVKVRIYLINRPVHFLNFFVSLVYFHIVWFGQTAFDLLLLFLAFREDKAVNHVFNLHKVVVIVFQIVEIVPLFIHSFFDKVASYGVFIYQIVLESFVFEVVSFM